MYAQSRHIRGADLASDSGSPNVSISMMTSISEQNEGGVPLDDDCPDYDAVVNKRQELSFFFPCAIFTLIYFTPLSLFQSTV